MKNRSRFSRYNEEKPVYPAITSVEDKGDYTLSVFFDNGENGLLDMKPYLNFGVFKKIQDPGIFKSARVSFDTISWETGADLAPEFVYKNCHILQNTC